MQGWEQRVQTGHPVSDQAELARLHHAASSQGLVMNATPLPGGGFHVRAYAAWAAAPVPVAAAPVPVAAAPVPVAAAPVPVAAAPVAAAGGPTPAQPAAPSVLDRFPRGPAGYLASPAGQDALRSSLVYAAEGAPAQILSDLGAIATIDKNSERLQGRWGWTSGGGCLLAIVGIFAGAALPPLFVFPVIGVVLFVVGLMRYGKYKRTNMEDRRYQLLGRIVRLLSSDADPRAPFRVVLGLAPSERKECLLGESQVYDWKVKHYKDPWLAVAGRFSDGTAFELEQTELLQVRSKWKRNYRGKMKHKTKRKVALACTLSLKYKPSRYAQLERLGKNASQAVQLPHGCAVKQFSHQPGLLTLKVAGKHDWIIPVPGESRYNVVNGLDVIAMMFLSCYQVLNLARKLDA